MREILIYQKINNKLMEMKKTFQKAWILILKKNFMQNNAQAFIFKGNINFQKMLDIQYIY